MYRSALHFDSDSGLPTVWCWNFLLKSESVSCLDEVVCVSMVNVTLLFVWVVTDVAYAARSICVVVVQIRDRTSGIYVG